MPALIFQLRLHESLIQAREWGVPQGSWRNALLLALLHDCDKIAVAHVSSTCPAHSGFNKSQVANCIAAPSPPTTKDFSTPECGAVRVPDVELVVIRADCNFRDSVTV